MHHRFQSFIILSIFASFSLNLLAVVKLEDAEKFADRTRAAAVAAQRDFGVLNTMARQGRVKGGGVQEDVIAAQAAVDEAVEADRKALEIYASVQAAVARGVEQGDDPQVNRKLIEIVSAAKNAAAKVREILVKFRNAYKIRRHQDQRGELRRLMEQDDNDN